MSQSSRQIQVNEILKCGNDPIYFINKYAFIQHPKKGTIPFKTYEFQNDVITSMLNNRFNIVLKSRQLGLSTITAAYAAWLALFHKDKNILIIATKKDVAINLIKKIKFLINSLPSWLILSKFDETMTSIRFANGSEIKAVPTSADAGRSEALSLLIVDEAAFVRDFDDIWTGLSPTLSTGGSAIILSTPNGVGGRYYKLWTEAEAGQNNFVPIKLPWYVHPEHDQEWFDGETANMPKKKIAQEYICDFSASGDTFLQTDVLDVIKETICNPESKMGLDRNVWIWKKPINNHRYVISADVSRGDSNDYSAFHIIDSETYEAVGEYMGKIPPEKLAELMIEYGKMYNYAMLCPENNSFGYSTAATLKKSGYTRLYYHDHKGDPFNYISNNETLPGFSTQTKSRLQILTLLEEMLRNKLLKTYSQRLFDQLKAFVWIGAKPQALKDSYDDLILSLAIGTWLISGNVDINEHDIAFSRAILESTKVERHDKTSLSIGDAYSLNNPKNLISNKLRDSHIRDINDFSWLLK